MLVKKSQMEKKERLHGADFVRGYAMLMIVLFHAFVQLLSFNMGKYPFTFFANGDFGLKGVTLFFACSGAVLYYNHASIKLNTKEIGAFYKKRWMSIFPAFYLVWLGEYIHRVLINRSFFFNGNPLSMILSLFGMDGYFSYLVQKNYYIVGEWFLGAIIILYLLFPLINACFQKNAPITLIITALCSYLPIGLSFWKIIMDRNIFICLLSFVFGMYYIKYREKIINRITFIIAVILDVVLLCVHISDFYYIRLVSGYLAFVVLYELGSYIMMNEKIKRPICFLSGISYEVFLVHHLVIGNIISDPRPMPLYMQWAFVAYTVIYSVAMGWLVHSIAKYIIKYITK
ncbi:MAG: acyltransferase [Lachnospiraceae bacterium]|nr:acyltransferase [Lachnospiraceae bacterium]